MSEDEQDVQRGDWDRSDEREEFNEALAEETRVRRQYFPNLRPGIAPREPDVQRQEERR